MPQRAVQQGAKGHFAWVINKDGKAEQRPLVVGDWYGDSWFINEGLSAGDQVVVDGGQRLAPGAAVIVVQADGQAPPRGAGRQRRRRASGARTAARARMFSRFFIDTADLRGRGRHHPVPGRRWCR